MLGKLYPPEYLSYSLPFGKGLSYGKTGGSKLRRQQVQVECCNHTNGSYCRCSGFLLDVALCLAPLTGTGAYRNNWPGLPWLEIIYWVMMLLTFQPHS